MSRVAVASLTACTFLGIAALSSSPAEARLFEVYGQAQAGGMVGQGLGGEQKDNDFFSAAKGGAYGVLVGAEILFIDGWIAHDQFTNGSLTGTWTQFMLGFDVDIDIGDDPPPGQQPKLFVEFGAGAGFGLGTGQQVDPPLDNAQVSDKGFVAQMNLGLFYKLNPLMSLGLAVPVQYGYLIKNDLANDLGNHYHSVHASPMAYLRFNVGK